VQVVEIGLLVVSSIGWGERGGDGSPTGEESLTLYPQVGSECQSSRQSQDQSQVRRLGQDPERCSPADGNLVSLIHAVQGIEQKVNE
jgi:hypothetical protein